MKAFEVDGSNRDREDTVCVAVKVALVSAASAVPAGKDKDGALAGPALLYSIHHGLLDQVTGPLHGPSVIRGSPAAGVDRSILVVVVQGRSLVDVGNGAREDPDASDLGIVREANSTDIVLHSGDLPCTAGAVVVIEEDGCRQRGMIVVIIRPVRILRQTRSAYACENSPVNIRSWQPGRR